MREFIKRLSEVPADECDLAIQTFAIIGALHLCAELVLFVVFGLPKLFR